MEANIKPELLAPAGSVDCLKAAFLAGADAVYLAGKRFGARAFASNFDEQNLRWARKVSRALKKKLYITLNTIVFEHEWRLLNETLDFIEGLQPDALIVQDIGVAVELRRRGSSIPIHLSTQGAWYGLGGVEQLQELGVARVILPREASKKEIAAIVEKVPFEIEVFVHGAMCYSISGRCFWSAALGTRSGNRGTCAQPCRREYRLADTPFSGCLFSPRDLRLIDEVQPLMATGIASLKIEGRMKSPEYVYQVVKAYRAAIDGKKQPDDKSLDEVFSRAFSIGFFNGSPKPSEWKTGDNPGREGIVVGITTGKGSDGLTELLCKSEIKAGDGLFWYEGGEERGARITWAGKDRVKSGIVQVRGLPKGLGKGIEIRRTSKSSDENWESKWTKDLERRPLDLFWSGYEGTPLAVESIINGHKLHLETEDKLQNALLKGLDEGPLQEKFDIIGEEYKASRHFMNHLGKRLHISSTALKRLKRALLEELNMLERLPSSSVSANSIVANKEAFLVDKHLLYKSDTKENFLRLRLWNNSSFKPLSSLKPDAWVIPFNSDLTEIKKLCRDKDVIYWLPPVLNYSQFDELYAKLRSFKTGSFLCFGWEAFKFAKLLPRLKFELDWCFNIANLNSLGYLRKQGLDGVLSKEWKDEDIPSNLNALRASVAWNPLVSYTRFPEAIKTNQKVSNSHKDNFFTLPLGNGVTAMFLEEKPIVLTGFHSSLQLDIAISPKENLTQSLKQLNQIIESFRKQP